MQNQNTGRASRKWRIHGLHLLAMAFAITLALSISACGGGDDDAGDPTDSSSAESKKPSEGAETPEECLEQMFELFEAEDKKLFIAYIVDSEIREAERKSNGKHFIDKFVEEAPSGFKWESNRCKRAGEKALNITAEDAKGLGVRQFWIKAIDKVLFVDEKEHGIKSYDLGWMKEFQDLEKLAKLGHLPGKDEIDKVRKAAAAFKEKDPSRYMQANAKRAEFQIGAVNVKMRKQGEFWYVDGITDTAMDIWKVTHRKY